MSKKILVDIIAKVRSEFPQKFGIPRQSGLADTSATVVFEPEYRDPDIIRGIEEYSYLWLIWEFSATAKDGWSPTVRPPKLGGNIRKGVFATRSPFRPNPIGLSSVKLEKVDAGSEGPVLHISGADLMDGTPVIDIKPYIPYTDAHPEALSGFAVKDAGLEIVCPKPLLERLPQDRRKPLIEVLKQDPRPGYHNEPGRVYGFRFAGFHIRFVVENKVLTVIDVLPFEP